MAIVHMSLRNVGPSFSCCAVGHDCRNATRNLLNISLRYGPSAVISSISSLFPKTKKQNAVVTAVLALFCWANAMWFNFFLLLNRCVFVFSCTYFKSSSTIQYKNTFFYVVDTMKSYCRCDETHAKKHCIATKAIRNKMAVMNESTRLMFFFLCSWRSAFLPTAILQYIPPLLLASNKYSGVRRIFPLVLVGNKKHFLVSIGNNQAILVSTKHNCSLFYIPQKGATTPNNTKKIVGVSKKYERTESKTPKIVCRPKNTNVCIFINNSMSGLRGPIGALVGRREKDTIPIQTSTPLNVLWEHTEEGVGGAQSCNQSPILICLCDTWVCYGGEACLC
jgi:hypothetical protein